MAKNEIQMQIGFSLDNFSSTYGTVEQCEAAVEKSKWPFGFRCTECGADHPYIYRKSTGNSSSVKVFQCSSCRKQVTLNEGTIFQSTKLPLTKWFQAMLLMTQSKNNISVLELRRLLGVSYPAAWRVKHKLMQVMYERELTTVLSGRVEVDDAYLGGELQGGKASRGSENKIPFIAAVAKPIQPYPLPTSVLLVHHPLSLILTH